MSQSPESGLGLQAAGFSRRLTIGLCAAGVGSFLLALVLTIYQDRFGREVTHEPSSYSSGAVGHRALRAFLEASGVNVVVSRYESARKAGARTPLLMLEPNLQSEQLVKALLEQALAGEAPVLLALPKWYAYRGKAPEGWVERLALIPDAELQQWCGKLDTAELPRVEVGRLPGATTLACRTSWGEPLRLRAPRFQLLSTAMGLEPVVWAPEGVVLGRAPGSRLYVLSDPDLLHNLGLEEADNAVMILRLLADQLGAHGVVLDEAIHGFKRNETLLAEMGRFPLVLLTGHGLLVLGLVLWAGVGRFGEPRPDASRLDAGRQVLIDNTARLLDQGGHLGVSLSRYYAQTLRSVGRRYSLPAQLRTEELAERLQALSDARGVEVRLARIGEQIDGLKRGAHKAQAVRLAHALYRWREEMLMTRREL